MSDTAADTLRRVLHLRGRAAAWWLLPLGLRLLVLHSLLLLGSPQGAGTCIVAVGPPVGRLQVHPPPLSLCNPADLLSWYAGLGQLRALLLVRKEKGAEEPCLLETTSRAHLQQREAGACSMPCSTQPSCLHCPSLLLTGA